MPRSFAATVFVVILWAVSAERSSAAMWLVKGPGNTSMAADSACKVRDSQIDASDSSHLWVDCLIADKHVTLMIASVAPFIAKDFTFKNAGQFFAKFINGTEWSGFKDGVEFLGGPFLPRFRAVRSNEIDWQAM